MRTDTRDDSNHLFCINTGYTACSLWFVGRKALLLQPSYKVHFTRRSRALSLSLLNRPAGEEVWLAAVIALNERGCSSSCSKHSLLSQVPELVRSRTRRFTTCGPWNPKRPQRESYTQHRPPDEYRHTNSPEHACPLLLSSRLLAQRPFRAVLQYAASPSRRCLYSTAPTYSPRCSHLYQSFLSAEAVGALHARAARRQKRSLPPRPLAAASETITRSRRKIAPVRHTLPAPVLQKDVGGKREAGQGGEDGDREVRGRRGHRQ